MNPEAPETRTRSFFSLQEWSRQQRVCAVEVVFRETWSGKLTWQAFLASGYQLVWLCLGYTLVKQYDMDQIGGGYNSARLVVSLSIYILLTVFAGARSTGPALSSFQSSRHGGNWFRAHRNLHSWSNLHLSDPGPALTRYHVID